MSRAIISKVLTEAMLADARLAIKRQTREVMEAAYIKSVNVRGKIPRAALQEPRP